MSILKILDLFDTEQMSKDELDVFKSRREAFKKMSNFSKKLSMAAIPAGVLSALPKIAKAQEAPDVIGVLNYALTLEHLEYRYYQMGVEASGLIPAEDMPVFEQIRKHEQAHVVFLQDTIEQLGGTPVAEPTFDFTAGGTFANPHDPANYAVFMALAQGFEDTGVRAYKGQAGNLKTAPGENVVLTAALSIHGVEARHASQVRRMRGKKGWITQAQPVDAAPEATQPIYAGEDNLIQGGVNVTELPGDVGADAATQAYDEPLTMAAVLEIANLFIVQ